jgi:hypothetical protein
MEQDNSPIHQRAGNILRKPDDKWCEMRQFMFLVCVIRRRVSMGITCIVLFVYVSCNRKKRKLFYETRETIGEGI